MEYLLLLLIGRAQLLPITACIAEAKKKTPRLSLLIEDAESAALP